MDVARWLAEIDQLIINREVQATNLHQISLEQRNSGVEDTTVEARRRVQIALSRLAARHAALVTRA
jgi:hypothetical protein